MRCTHARGDAAGRDQVARLEALGHVRFELVGRVTVARADDHAVAREQRGTTAVVQLDPLVLPDVCDGGQYYIARLGSQMFTGEDAADRFESYSTRRVGESRPVEGERRLTAVTEA